MNVKGSVYKRCGCRIPGTRQRFGNACPALARRGHGSWYYALDICPYPGSCRRRIRRGGFPSRLAAEEALGQLQTPGPGDRASPLVTTGQWLQIWLAGCRCVRPRCAAMPVMSTTTCSPIWARSRCVPWMSGIYSGCSPTSWVAEPPPGGRSPRPRSNAFTPRSAPP
jgi:hypothetical protein